MMAEGAAIKNRAANVFLGRPGSSARYASAGRKRKIMY
jgi:hypothetical protein